MLSDLLRRSRHGIVNVYGTDATSSQNSGVPKPLKSIGNLTTSISTMSFNADSQLLAIASNIKKDQMRMVQVTVISLAGYSFNRFSLSGPPAFSHRVFQLADIWHTVGPRHQHGLLDW